MLFRFVKEDRVGFLLLLLLLKYIIMIDIDDLIEKF